MVVGAGVAGLVAAIDLARAGFGVTVLEAGATAGGKLAIDTLEFDGQSYAIDCGPTVLTMAWVFEELFERCGERLRDHVTMHAAPIVARHAWRTSGKNGAPTFDLANTVEASIDEVGSFFGKKEAENFRAFAKTTKAIWDTVKEPFVVAQRPTAWSVLRDLSERGFGAALEIDGLRTLHQSLTARFEDPRLQQLFGRYATYCGSSPFAAPATLALVAHVEQEGVYHVAGGMRALANALYQLALRQGVTFQFKTSVSEIVVRYGRVVGVRTGGPVATATEVSAALVVHAGDAQALATGLFGAEATRAVKAVEREDRSLSAYTFSMLARPTGLPLARHTVVFSDDYAREFRELFSQRILPSEPTVYICAQDREAPGQSGPAVSRAAAPSIFAGGPAADDVTRLFLIVNAPAIGDDGPLPVAELDRCEATLHRLLNDCGFQLNPEKTVRRTPYDFSKRFPATGGALYGRASHGPFSAFQRPGATTPIPGLFLASGSIHLGAGVPMAALSGRLAAIAAVTASPSTRRSPRTATAGFTPTA